MHAHGIDVFDGTHHHKIIDAVAHHFELIFLPANHRLLNEHLGDGRGPQATFGDFAELGFVVADATTATTKGKRWPDQDGVADFGGHGHGLFDGGNGFTQRHTQPDFEHGLFEQLTIFGEGDGFGLGAQQLHVVLGKHAQFVQFHGQVEGCLATYRGQNSVGALFDDDLFNRLGGEWLDVGGIGKLRIGHDGGGV